MLNDADGRTIRYLRLSLTESCQMRCTYCRPDWLTNTPHHDTLQPDEIHWLVSHLVQRHGLRKVRLTGGDPTARADLLEIIRRIASIPGIEDLAMTTNGLTLAHRAHDYAAAGLRRVNVSLDSLDPQRFTRLTGVDAMERVIRGIDAARQAGLGPVKINTVVVRHNNEDELVDLARFAAERSTEIRFIELMPMGPLAEQWADRYVTAAEMRRNLEQHFTGWEPIDQGSDSATRYAVTDPHGNHSTVGFITPMSCNFCDACNRIRITSRAQLYPCLMDKPAGSLMPAFRDRRDPDLLDDLLARGLSHKQPHHPQEGHVVMTHIGG